MLNRPLVLVANRSLNGRALLLGPTGSVYVSRGFSIHRSDDGGGSWLLDCVVPAKGWKPCLARRPLFARYLRHNIQAFQVLPDGGRVAVARDGIYRAEPGETYMRKTWSVTRGARPINLSVDGNRLIFGEYGNLLNAQVRIYLSQDGGRRFETVFEFPRGDVIHIHNVIVDPYEKFYWVLAGDHGQAPGIGRLSRDCRHLDWIGRGNQMLRAVNMIVRPDYLVYGSDSEVETNYIIRLDKKTGCLERVMPIDGSSLYAADFGSFAAISTCVEPSRVNHGRNSTLYGSRDLLHWEPVISIPKDRWSSNIFQFGLLVLPIVRTVRPIQGMFSGQALQGWHNSASLFPV